MLLQRELTTLLVVVTLVSTREPAEALQAESEVPEGKEIKEGQRD